MRSAVFLVVLAGILLALNTGHIEALFEVGLVVSVLTFLFAVWVTRNPRRS